MAYAPHELVGQPMDSEYQRKRLQSSSQVPVSRSPLEQPDRPQQPLGQRTMNRSMKQKLDLPFPNDDPGFRPGNIPGSGPLQSSNPLFTQSRNNQPQALLPDQWPLGAQDLVETLTSANSISAPHRTELPGVEPFDGNSGPVHSDQMDVSPQAETPPDQFPNGNTAIIRSPMAQEYPFRPQVEPETVSYPVNDDSIPSQGSRLARLRNLIFGKKNKWLVFGGDKSYHSQSPLDDETAALPNESLNKSMLGSVVNNVSSHRNDDIKKMSKKEAKRLQIEAEKERRKLLEKMQREQARAVMQKRNQLLTKSLGDDIEWLDSLSPKRIRDSKNVSSGPIRREHGSTRKNTTSPVVDVAAGRYGRQTADTERDWLTGERIPKSRRRDFDDDHSMSSFDIHNLGQLSSVSLSTVDSDPGLARIRNRPSISSINGIASMQCLRASFDHLPSASSSTYSLDGQLAPDFSKQALMNSSPPPMQGLTLSPSISPHSPWLPLQTPPDGHYHNQVEGSIHTLPHHPPPSYGRLPGLDGTPKSSKSALNPIFKVPPLPSPDHLPAPTNALPPFSELEAVADGEYSPVSPMTWSQRSIVPIADPLIHTRIASTRESNAEDEEYLSPRIESERVLNSIHLQDTPDIHDGHMEMNVGQVILSEDLLGSIGDSSAKSSGADNVPGTSGNPVFRGQTTLNGIRLRDGSEEYGGHMDDVEMMLSVDLLSDIGDSSVKTYGDKAESTDARPNTSTVHSESGVGGVNTRTNGIASKSDLDESVFCSCTLYLFMLVFLVNVSF